MDQSMDNLKIKYKILLYTAIKHVFDKIYFAFFTV